MLTLRKKLDQPRFYIYLKNSVSLIIFFFIKFAVNNKRIKNLKNILFINTGQIGDLVLSTSILLNEDLFPHDKIYLLVKKQYSDFFVCYNGKVKLIFWDYDKYRYSLVYRYKFIRGLQSLHLESVINLTTARGPLNDELTILSGAVSKYCLNNDYKYLKRIFGRYYDRHYNKIFDFSGKTEYDKQISSISFVIKKVASHGIHFYLSQKKIDEAKKFLDKYSIKKYRKIIIANPYSDIEEKNWHSLNYRKLFLLFDQEDFIVLCQGSSRQRGGIEELVAGLNNVFNIAGELTLSQSAALISLSSLYIGNDSGFTHIAKALNKTIIAIIGGGSYGSFFPYLGKENEYLLYHDVDCKGCEWRCIHKERVCIDRITAEEVYELTVRILK